MGSKRRPPKGKKINPTFFVFCEGRTEESYVNFLKSKYRIPSIQINSSIGGNNISLKHIEKYKEGKPTHEKDLDLLMYDIDVPHMLERLLKLKGCILLASNPSIELWFLLHYKNQSANVDTAYCCKELKNRNKVYKKGVIDSKLKAKFSEKTEAAVNRALALGEHSNPSSTVYRFIKILEELKK